MSETGQAWGKNRRASILQAALECFTEHGIEGTTIEMIRDKSGASTGSLYHHFANKEDIASTLFLDGLHNYSERLLKGLAACSDARDGIEMMVTSYIDWVTENPDWARFIFSARGRMIRGDAAEALKENNRAQFTALRDWLQPHIEQGELQPLPLDLYHALVNGPIQDYCRSWLAGRVRHSPRQHARTFANAAWRSVAA